MGEDERAVREAYARALDALIAILGAEIAAREQAEAARQARARQSEPTLMLRRMRVQAARHQLRHEAAG